MAIFNSYVSLPEGISLMMISRAFPLTKKFQRIKNYPLVNIQKPMENPQFLIGKSSISMAIFYVANC